MTTVGVFFGGRSVEHEVSVITAMQTIAAFPETLTPVPIYIAKSGAWYTGDALRTLDGFRDVERLIAGATRVTLRAEPDADGIALVKAQERRTLLGGGARDVLRLDVALPLVHGTHGEDGTLQGLFELCDLAYCGSNVAASAVSMDKRLAKSVFRAAGLAVVDDELITRDDWNRDAATLGARVGQRFEYPLYVKPMSLGSSIGVSRVESPDELRQAVDLALSYDTRCLVEPSQEGIVEINCAVLGAGDSVRPSACEQPKTGGLLSYADKYLSKGAKPAQPSGPAGKQASQRIVPAPLSDGLTSTVQQTALAAFTAIGAEGVARVDFLVRPERAEVIVNEINTVPGSLSFYLWQPLGVTFTDLVSELVDLALARKRAKAQTAYSIDTWLLTGPPPR